MPSKPATTITNASNIKLKLLKDLEFSMTDFDKVNKGMANSRNNCFMNVTMQSLVACPAFMNMLTAISESEAFYERLTEKRELLGKFIEMSRYFEPRVNVTGENPQYKARTVDAQQIFYKELLAFNPDNIQADCSEFMAMMLDRLHEEMKDIYVSNEKTTDSKDWTETATKN